MNYISTRGAAPALAFDDTLLAGLARDGGLYVPERWPQLSPGDIAALAGLPYAEPAVSFARSKQTDIGASIEHRTGVRAIRENCDYRA